MSAAAFARLHSKIQEAVWQQQWDELRPLQVEAIHAVLDSDDHVILAAATASGKTEAAFLPILSLLAAEPLNSVQALYVSPLKALINDQFRRLEDLCAHAEIPVHRWHGDVSATEKQHLRKTPGGVLLITPESLESQFINHDRHLARIYANLRLSSSTSCTPLSTMCAGFICGACLRGLRSRLAWRRGELVYRRRSAILRPQKSSSASTRLAMSDFWKIKHRPKSGASG
jgi:hypothetical protein